MDEWHLPTATLKSSRSSSFLSQTYSGKYGHLQAESRQRYAEIGGKHKLQGTVTVQDPHTKEQIGSWTIATDPTKVQDRAVATTLTFYEQLESEKGDDNVWLAITTEDGRAWRCPSPFNTAPQQIRLGKKADSRHEAPIHSALLYPEKNLIATACSKSLRINRIDDSQPGPTSKIIRTGSTHIRSNGDEIIVIDGWHNAIRFFALDGTLKQTIRTDHPIATTELNAHGKRLAFGTTNTGEISVAEAPGFGLTSLAELIKYCLIGHIRGPKVTPLPIQQRKPVSQALTSRTTKRQRTGHIRPIPFDFDASSSIFDALPDDSE